MRWSRGFHALLIKQAAAYRRVALDLHPFLGLFADLAGQGEFAQVEICTKIAV